MPYQEQASRRDFESKEELSQATSREIFQSLDSKSYFPLSHPELCVSQGINCTLVLAKFFNFESETRIGQKVCLYSTGSRPKLQLLSLIHISEPTRLLSISYAVFCLKKKKMINLTSI